jgi:hypothetical protein
MMTAIASSIVDLSALWKIVVVTVIAGIGVVGAFGYVLLGISRYQTVRVGGSRAAYVLLVMLAGAFCLAVVILGAVALAHK